MESKGSFEERHKFWKRFVLRTGRIRVTDFEAGVLAGMSTSYDLQRAEADRLKEANRSAT